MRLAERTDYALRALMILATGRDRRSVRELAHGLHVSANHLAKVVQMMEARGWVATSAGRAGGVELAAEPRRLRLGDVVRQMEPDLALVECLRDGGACPLEGHCRLKRALRSARQSFLDELDAVTLEDLVSGRERRLLRATIGATA